MSVVEWVMVLLAAPMIVLLWLMLVGLIALVIKAMKEGEL